jgi:hypothetical protein
MDKYISDFVFKGKGYNRGLTYELKLSDGTFYLYTEYHLTPSGSS